MAKIEIARLFFYRWRYVIGYALVGLLLAGLLIFAGLYVPGGISREEINATIQSNALALNSLDGFAIPHLPYYLLQAAIFALFGVYDFTIKLPSLILALLSALGLILLLRRWFKPNIAVLASLIAVTTGQFLFVAQNGAPGILYIFWPVALMLLGTQITRGSGKRFRVVWKMLFALTAALSLYTPLSIYPLLAMVLVTILHPHLRSAVRRLSKLKIAVGILLAAIILAPLAIGIVRSPQLGLTLLGAPAVWPPDLLANIQTLLRQYFAFWEPSTTTLMTPVFGFGSALLIGLGLYRLIRTRETTRSYLLIIWTICLIPVLLLNPRFTSVGFVPSVLLLAAGLTSLIGYWYRLFPLNPYARIAGLVPIVVLVAVLIGSGIDRYVYGYHYDPLATANFSKDLRLLPKDTRELVVSGDELAFYQAVARHRPGLTVSTQPTTDRFTATRAAVGLFNGYELERIVTTASKDDANRFYLYKRAGQ